MKHAFRVAVLIGFAIACSQARIEAQALPSFPDLSSYLLSSNGSAAYSPLLTRVNAALLLRNLLSMRPSETDSTNVLTSARGFLEAGLGVGTRGGIDALLESSDGRPLHISCAIWTRSERAGLQRTCRPFQSEVGKLSSGAISNWASRVTGGRVTDGINADFELSGRTTAVIALAARGKYELDGPSVDTSSTGRVPVTFLQGDAPVPSKHRAIYHNMSVSGVALPLKKGEGTLYYFNSNDLSELRAFERLLPSSWESIKKGFHVEPSLINLPFVLRSELYYHTLPGQQLAIPGFDGIGEFGEVQRIFVQLNENEFQFAAEQTFSFENPPCCDDYIGVPSAKPEWISGPRPFLLILESRGQVPLIIES